MPTSALVKEGKVNADYDSATSDLRHLLLEIAESYPRAVQQPFASNPTARLLIHA